MPLDLTDYGQAVDKVLGIFRNGLPHAFYKVGLFVKLLCLFQLLRRLFIALGLSGLSRLFPLGLIFRKIFWIVHMLPPANPACRRAAAPTRYVK